MRSARPPVEREFIMRILQAAPPGHGVVRRGREAVARSSGVARVARAIAIALALAAPLSAFAATDSVAEQLQREGVRPGTALARLIAENQDTGVLRPDEARDRLPYPAWLRVYWRKAHPEGRFDASDPTGGYPRALGSIHRWMLAHQDLVPGPGDGASAATKRAVVEKTTVGGNTQVSPTSASPQSESAISIKRSDPSRIVAASNNIGGSGAQSQYFSANGGVTWGRTEVPVAAGDAFNSDPVVDWTSDGTAWSMTLGIDNSQTVLKGRAYKSTDNGATWTLDGTFSGAQTDVDKEMMWVDHSATSPFKDNIYAIWHNGLPAFVGRRTAAGWQTPVQVSGAESTGTAIGGDVRTNSAGDLFAFWPTTGNRRLFVSKSTTGGASFAAPVQIGTTFDGFDIGVPSFSSRRALIYVSGGAYRTMSPVARNEVYASWVDLTGAANCTSSGNEPGTNAASTCKTRVWFSRSTDGGATWSAKVMLNNQAGLNDQYNQWLTVDDTNGMLGIIYYDTVADPARLKTDVWYQSSFDGGATWSAAIKITTLPTDETGSGADLGNQYGDYNGLTANAGLVYPSWTDRRAGGLSDNEQIWTAQIDERVTLTAAGAGAGAGDMTGAGVACHWSGAATSGTCTEKVPRLATSSIVAVPSAGSSFTSWSGCTSTSTTTIAGDTCEVAPNTNVGVTATFGAALGTNADLSNLVLSAGGLAPAFASGTVSYTASIVSSTNTVTVTPTAADATATIKVNGNTVASGAASAPITLAVGSNPIATVVTAQDGVTTKTYTVDVSYSLPSPCQYAVSPPDVANFAKAGGTVIVTVTVPGGCSVSVTSFQPWVTVNGITPGPTTTTVSLQIAANAGAARATSIVLAERLYLITQAAGP